MVGKGAPASLQRSEFMAAAAQALCEPLLSETSVDTWKRALELVVGRWRGAHKLILILDEFQWTAEASPELPSVLQELWDRDWKRSGKVMLVVCGSFIGFMEREVLGEKSPLFGRRTAQIHLKPFSFSESRQFHSAASIESPLEHTRPRPLPRRPGCQNEICTIPSSSWSPWATCHGATP
jgi:uncharacterized protein